MYSGAQKASWILNFVLLCLCIFLWFKPAGEAHRVVYDKIKKIEVVRHDTLMKLDTVLKYKIKVINDAPDSVVVYKIDSLYGNNAHADTVFVSRELLKCKDSLGIEILKDTINTETIMKIDSVVKVVDTEKPTRIISDRLKDVGVGLLVGVGIRSLF
jgi:hypothetical protein